MPIALRNREAIRRISPALEEELEALIASFQGEFLVEHDSNGHHTSIRVDSIRTPTYAEKNPLGVIPSVTNVSLANSFDLPPSIVPDPSTVGTGDVVGPASATDGDIALYNGATGKLIKDSGVTYAALDTRVTSVETIAAASLVSLSLTINDSTIKALNTTPQVIVTGVGGKTIVPVFWCTKKGPWANAYSANPSFRIRFAGIATDILTNIAPSIGGTGFNYVQAVNASPSLTTSAVGLNLQLSSSADVTSVGDTTTNTVVIQLAYYVL